MISKKLSYAVVGASKNPDKYGHKVFKDLLNAGYDVFPINLKEPEILGETAYKTLATTQKNIDVVVTVVPPSVTEQIVREANELGIKNVWMQPGSESKPAIEYCYENGISLVYDACIMVERHKADGN